MDERRIVWQSPDDVRVPVVVDLIGWRKAERPGDGFVASVRGKAPLRWGHQKDDSEVA